MRITSVFVLVAVSAGSTGCAAVFKGGQADVQFVSDPDGATVENQGQFLGKTPAVGAIDRNGSLAIKVSKPGYEDGYGVLTRKPNAPWWIADIATCAIPVLLCVPLVVDAITGAWMDVQPTYRVQLKPVAPAPVTPTAAVVPTAR